MNIPAYLTDFRELAQMMKVRWDNVEVEVSFVPCLLMLGKSRPSRHY
jgi:hypothetical protein